MTPTKPPTYRQRLAERARERVLELAADAKGLTASFVAEQLNVSRLTATRWLERLEAEGKLACSIPQRHRGTYGTAPRVWTLPPAPRPRALLAPAGCTCATCPVHRTLTEPRIDPTYYRQCLACGDRMYRPEDKCSCPPMKEVHPWAR